MGDVSLEERLVSFQERLNSGDPLTDEEERYLLAAVDRLQEEIRAQEAILKRMERGKYRDMLLSGIIGWLVGFVLGLVLHFLGMG